MRRKRLMCICAALLLLLTVPVRAEEAPVLPETPETWEESPIAPAPPADDPAAAPEAPETPEDPDVPENPEQPENPETAEIPDETGPAGELEQPSQDEQVPAEAPLPEEFPIINVSVPGSCRVIVNPYRLEVNLDGETSREQIVSETGTMTNLSEIPVSVSARAAGTTYGPGMMFVASPPAVETRWKELFLYIEFQNEWSGGAWSGRYTNAANQLPVAPEPVEKLNVLELSSGETGFYRVFGAAATQPEAPWSAGDDFRVTLTFTFTPLAAGAMDFLGMPEAWEVPELPGAAEIPEIPEISEFPEDPAGPDETEWEDVLY